MQRPCPTQVVETLTAERGFAIMRASNCSQHKENLTEVITAQWQQLAQREVRQNGQHWHGSISALHGIAGSREGPWSGNAASGRHAPFWPSPMVCSLDHCWSLWVHCALPASCLRATALRARWQGTWARSWTSTRLHRGSGQSVLGRQARQRGCREGRMEVAGTLLNGSCDRETAILLLPIHSLSSRLPPVAGDCR